MDYTRVTESMCAKCVMRGGEEEPCVPPPTLVQMQAKGQACPRVDLAPENEVPAELAWFASKLGADHQLFEMLFALHASEASREERLDLFYRVVDAVSDPGISGRIKAARERALREDRQGG